MFFTDSCNLDLTEQTVIGVTDDETALFSADRVIPQAGVGRDHLPGALRVARRALTLGVSLELLVEIPFRFCGMRHLCSAERGAKALYTLCGSKQEIVYALAYGKMGTPPMKLRFGPGAKFNMEDPPEALHLFRICAQTGQYQHLQYAEGETPPPSFFCPKCTGTKLVVFGEDSEGVSLIMHDTKIVDKRFTTTENEDKHEKLSYTRFLVYPDQALFKCSYVMGIRAPCCSRTEFRHLNEEDPDYWRDRMGPRGEQVLPLRYSLHDYMPQPTVFGYIYRGKFHVYSVINTSQPDHISNLDMDNERFIARTRLQYIKPDGNVMLLLLADLQDLAPGQIKHRLFKIQFRSGLKVQKLWSFGAKIDLNYGGNADGMQIGNVNILLGPRENRMLIFNRKKLTNKVVKPKIEANKCILQLDDYDILNVADGYDSDLDAVLLS